MLFPNEYLKINNYYFLLSFNLALFESHDLKFSSSTFSLHSLDDMGSFVFLLFRLNVKYKFR